MENVAAAPTPAVRQTAGVAPMPIAKGTVTAMRDVAHAGSAGRSAPAKIVTAMVRVGVDQKGYADQLVQLADRRSARFRRCLPGSIATATTC